MPEETKQDTEERMQRWTYAGQQTNDYSTGKLTHVWYVMQVDGSGHFVPSEKCYYFDPNIVRKVIGNRSPRIGGMWDIWITPTDKGISVTTGGQHEPQPVGPYEGPEVVQWEMRTVTALALKDARAAARKLMQGSELSTILAPVREAYAKAVGVQRAALLAAIVTEITQPYGGLPGKPARPAKAKAKRRK